METIHAGTSTVLLGVLLYYAFQRIVYRYEGNTLELKGKGESLEEFFSQQESLLGG